MVGKPTRDRRRLILEMLNDLCENNGYEVLKRTAEDRKYLERKHWKESAKNLLYSGQSLKKKKKSSQFSAVFHNSLQPGG